MQPPKRRAWFRVPLVVGKVCVLSADTIAKQRETLRRLTLAIHVPVEEPSTASDADLVNRLVPADGANAETFLMPTSSSATNVFDARAPLNVFDARAPLKQYTMTLYDDRGLGRDTDGCARPEILAECAFTSDLERMVTQSTTIVGFIAGVVVAWVYNAVRRFIAEAAQERMPTHMRE